MVTLADVVITAINGVATVFSEKNRFLQMVNRGSFGLSFCIDGKITYTHKGKDYVSDPQHAIILPKGATYRLYGNEAGQFPLMNFQSSNLQLDAPLVIPLRNPEGYLADYEALKNAMIVQRGHAKVMSILYDMLHRLSYEQQEHHSILAPAITYLEGHFADPQISIGDLAQKCGISEIYFRQQFGKLFHRSPKQYIIDLRIRKAKQLLVGSDLSVAQVAEQCGFTNPYHFSRTFKDITGLTPTAYKRQNKTYIV